MFNQVVQKHFLGTRINDLFLDIRLLIYIRGVIGGTDQTLGGCSLCYIIPI